MRMALVAWHTKHVGGGGISNSAGCDDGFAMVEEDDDGGVGDGVGLDDVALVAVEVESITTSC